MHGVGRVAQILRRTLAGRSRRFYQIVLEAGSGGQVLVPMEHARELGLRHPRQAQEVLPAVRRLQRAASRPTQRRQSAHHYAWCQERLRQDGALGLAEVRRFLYDLEKVEGFTNPHLRQLRTYVYTQIPTEIAQALRCSQADAVQTVDTALTSRRLPTLPLPS
jgi:RNA polymerase-interacting CarD/CdnL/TRCF family regulator